MELTNVVVTHVLPVFEGESKDGKSYRKQIIVVEELDDEYPEPIALEAFNKDVDVSEKFYVGQELERIRIKIKSREWQQDGKPTQWFTGISFRGIPGARRARTGTAPTPVATSAPRPVAAPQTQAPAAAGPDEGPGVVDDLPF